MKRTYVTTAPSPGSPVSVVVAPYRARSFGLLVMRVGIGIAMIVHGWPKLMGSMDSNRWQGMDQAKLFWNGLGQAISNIGLHPSGSAATVLGLCASLAEVVGGAMLAIGLLTRVMAFVLTFQMVVAVLTHLHMPAPMNTFNIGWSHAFELGCVFFGLLFMGPGAFSLDHALFRRRIITSTPGYDVTTTTEHIPGPTINRPTL